MTLTAHGQVERGVTIEVLCGAETESSLPRQHKKDSCEFDAIASLRVSPSVHRAEPASTHPRQGRVHGKTRWPDKLAALPVAPEYQQPPR